jgi:hypothetical protein
VFYYVEQLVKQENISDFELEAEKISREKNKCSVRRARNMGGLVTGVGGW